jgi:hypothetical protein
VIEKAIDGVIFAADLRPNEVVHVCTVEQHSPGGLILSATTTREAQVRNPTAGELLELVGRVIATGRVQFGRKRRDGAIVWEPIPSDTLLRLTK